MKRILTLLAIFSISLGAAYAQSDFYMSEQLFSRVGINPAGTGNSQNINLFGVTRFQYAGTKGAPFTALINVTGYIPKANSGLGLSLSYDQSGVAYDQMQAKLCYSYQICINTFHILSLGVGLGAIHKNFDPNKHVLDDDTERGHEFPSEYTRKTFFDASFGIEYNYQYLLLGASMTHIPGFFYSSDSTSTLTTTPNYYFYARGYIPCSEKFQIAPALSYYYTNQYHVIDTNVTMYFGKYIWFGLGYRTETTAYGLFGVEWEWLRVGYSCDVNIGKLHNVAWTSHEIMLSFSIPTQKMNGEWKY